MPKRTVYAIFCNGELVAAADGLENLGRAFACYVDAEMDNGEADLGPITVETTSLYEDGVGDA
jgi:hypothetical protein